MSATVHAIREELLEIPQEFICSIIMEVMRDPVICADGHTYERAAIETWLRCGYRTSPKTNLPLAHTTLTPNIALRQAIEMYMSTMPEIQSQNIQRRQKAMNLQEIIKLREAETTAKQYQTQTAKQPQPTSPTSVPTEIPQLALSATQINSAQLQAFLNQVVAGQQDEAEAMLKQNPALALGSGTVTDHAKRTFCNITGFQYAVWTLDWHMWRMIKKYLPLEEARLQSESFATGSWVEKHGEHVTWKRLIDNYQTYINKYDEWNYDQCCKYWLQEIGGAQLMLPMHVLQEYCQPNRPFYPVPKFSEDIILVRKLPEWLSDLAKIGKEFSIYRGPAGHCEGICLMLCDRYFYVITDADRNALIHLADTRLQQRGELVAELRSGMKFPKPIRVYLQ